MVNTQQIPYLVFTRYLPVYLPGYLPVLPPNLVFTWVFTWANTQVNTRSVFTCRFLRYPYYQICEITQFFKKIRTKMVIILFVKRYNTFKSKHVKR